MAKEPKLSLYVQYALHNLPKPGYKGCGTVYGKTATLSLSEMMGQVALDIINHYLEFTEINEVKKELDKFAEILKTAEFRDNG